MKIFSAKWFQFICVLTVLIAIYVWNLPKRNPASTDSPDVKLENTQIKTEMIQSIEWKDQGTDIQFLIHSKDPGFCDNWKTATIRLQAEGMGVSGDAPGARAVVACQQGRFEFMWPKQIELWKSPIEKTGDYIETPSRFYVGTIFIEGPAGQMKITNYEISAVRSETFDLTAQASAP